ncbi:MAG: ABC-type transport auxiliary lipoprotein family protein [Thiogranum sp.]|nr:ABC-type transport auxiliary lipoprotein family protein [Thiogranum sp.]
MKLYFWLLPALLLLQGCSASVQVPEDRFYQLRATAPIATYPAPVFSGGVIIDRVNADPMRSGRAILYSDAKKPLELKRYHYEFWIDQPPELVQRALLAHFRDSRLADRVIDDTERADADYRLAVRLQRFEQLWDSARQGADVDVELEVRLLANASRTTIWSQRYRQRRQVAGADMHATAAAMEAALGTILEQLANDLALLGENR